MIALFLVAACAFSNPRLIKADTAAVYPQTVDLPNALRIVVKGSCKTGLPALEATAVQAVRDLAKAGGLAAPDVTVHSWQVGNSCGALATGRVR